MYYKVLKDNKIIDILKNIFYIKYQEKNNLLLLCNIQEQKLFLVRTGCMAGTLKVYMISRLIAMNMK